MFMNFSLNYVQTKFNEFGEIVNEKRKNSNAAVDSNADTRR